MTTTFALTTKQVQDLKTAYSALGEVLSSIGVSPLPPHREPRRRREWHEMGPLMRAIAARGGRVSAEEWRALGTEHGYDPRGLGGFFKGDGATMRVDGDSRVLTDAGRRWIASCEREFGDPVEV